MPFFVSFFVSVDFMNHIYGMSVLSLLRRVRACSPGPLIFIDAHVLVWLKIKFKCTKNSRSLDIFRLLLNYYWFV